MNKQICGNNRNTNKRFLTVSIVLTVILIVLILLYMFQVKNNSSLGITSDDVVIAEGDTITQDSEYINDIDIKDYDDIEHNYREEALSMDSDCLKFDNEDIIYSFLDVYLIKQMPNNFKTQEDGFLYMIQRPDSDLYYLVLHGDDGYLHAMTIDEFNAKYNTGWTYDLIMNYM